MTHYSPIYNNTNDGGKMRDATDSFEYIWRTYRGRKALARRWTQTAKEDCKDCSKRHESCSDLIMGIMLTKDEIENYKKGIKHACPIGNNVRNNFETY